MLRNLAWSVYITLGQMRLLLGVLFALVMSGCAFVIRTDHFNPSSDHGKPVVHRRVPPNEKIFQAGEGYRLQAYALAVTSEVAWFGPLIPIFPGVLLRGLEDKDGDEPLTMAIGVAEYGKSLSINLDEVSVHRDFDSKPLRPLTVERQCSAKGTRKWTLKKVSGKQTLDNKRIGIDGEYCAELFYLKYEIKRKDVEIFEVHFGQVVVDEVASTPEPIRFKRAVDHWFLGVP
jgi:hypothetical protein